MIDIFHAFIEGLTGGGVGAEGSGFMDALLGLFRAGGADALGAMGELGSGESVFARAAGIFTKATDTAWDYMVWRDVLGGRGNQADWKNVTGSERTQVEKISTVVKSHAFLLQQGRANKINGKVLDQYEKLGMELPSPDLLKEMNRRLRSVFHTDKNNVDRQLFQDLQNSIKTLETPELTQVYNEMRLRKPEALKDIFDKITHTDMRKGYEAAEESLRLKLGFNGKSAQYSQAEKWVSELNGAQKTGLAFAAVGGVALAAYGAAAVMESRRRQKKAGAALRDSNDQGMHSQRIKEQMTTDEGRIAAASR